MEALRQKLNAKGILYIVFLLSLTFFAAEVVQKVFRSFDEKEEGVMSKDNFYAALKTVGMTLSRPEFDSILRSVGDPSSGLIRYREVADALKSKTDRFVFIHPLFS